jgi:hypothetical protein
MYADRRMFLPRTHLEYASRDSVLRCPADGTQHL